MLSKVCQKSLIYNPLTEIRTDGLHSSFYNYCKLYIGNPFYMVKKWFYFTETYNKYSILLKYV